MEMGDILIAALAAAIVFLLSSLLLRVLRRAWNDARSRYAAISRVEPQDLARVLDPASRLLVSVSSGLLVALAGWLFGGGRGALVGALAGAVLPWWWVRRLRRRWIERLEAQLPDALAALGGALRSGLSLQQGIEQVGQEADQPLQRELALVTRELRLGRTWEEAFGAFAARAASRDLELALAAISIARTLGGNLSDRLVLIAETIRQRRRIEGKIQALTAQGRMQARVIAGLPLLLGGAMTWMRPDLMEPMMEHAFGWALVATIVVLETCGLLIIRRIVEVDV